MNKRLLKALITYICGAEIEAGDLVFGVSAETAANVQEQDNDRRRPTWLLSFRAALSAAADCISAPPPGRNQGRRRDPARVWSLGI